MPLLMKELSQEEVARLPFKRSVLIAPVSPLERHGPHLPIGTDLILAEWLSNSLAHAVEKRWPDVRAVLFPPIPLGAQCVPGPGSSGIRQATTADLCYELLYSFRRSGFRNALFCSAHGSLGQLVAIEEACEKARWELGMRADSALSRVAVPFLQGWYRREIERGLGKRFSDQERQALKSDVHGGQWETGAMLCARPDLVKERYRLLPDVAYGNWFTLKDVMARSCEQGLGYVGAPSLATAEYARAAAEVMEKRVVKIVDRMLHARQFRPSHTPFYFIPGYRSPLRYSASTISMAAAAGMLAGVALTRMQLTSRRREAPESGKTSTGGGEG